MANNKRLSPVPSHVPADDDTLTITYGEYRQMARRADFIREGYGDDVRRSEQESDMWRYWALHLELLIMSRHPASSKPTGNVCPECGKRCPCPTRRQALAVRRHAAAEAELSREEHLEREARYANNRLASVKRSALPVPREA